MALTVLDCFTGEGVWLATALIVVLIVARVGAVPHCFRRDRPRLYFASGGGWFVEGEQIVNSVKGMFCLLATIAAIGWGCDSQNDPYATNPRGAAAPPYDVQRGGGKYARGSAREQQAAFLNRIRRSDPRFETIQRAVLNENNELGLVLSRNVEMDSIPAPDADDVD